MQGKSPAKKMFGACILTQLIIFLICSPLLPTTTHGRPLHDRLRRRIKHILENDNCQYENHIPEGNIECRECLQHFMSLPYRDRHVCPNARDAMCRVIDSNSQCTFRCDPTAVEMQATSGCGLVAESTIKTLRAITLPMRNELREREEFEHGRRVRREQRQERRENEHLQQEFLERQRVRNLQRMRDLRHRRREELRQQQQQYSQQYSQGLQQAQPWQQQQQYSQRLEQEQPWQQQQQYSQQYSQQLEQAQPWQQQQQYSQQYSQWLGQGQPWQQQQQYSQQYSQGLQQEQQPQQLQQQLPQLQFRPFYEQQQQGQSSLRQRTVILGERKRRRQE